MNNYRLTTHTLPQLSSWVGFDRVFNEIEEAVKRTSKAVGYPPYNVKKIDDENYVIELAAAGFSKTDINLTMKDGQLIIKGEVKSDPSAEYLYKGIAERAFERTFTLADSVVVKNASMVNGLLKIFLETFIPEEKKARSIPIGDTDDFQSIKDEKQLLTE